MGKKYEEDKTMLSMFFELLKIDMSNIAPTVLLLYHFDEILGRVRLIKLILLPFNYVRCANEKNRTFNTTNTSTL